MRRTTVRNFAASLNFNGSTASVDVPLTAGLQASVFTYAAWVKPGLNGARNIVAYNGSGGPKLRIGSGLNDLTFVKDGVAIIAGISNAVPMGVWSHVALSYDASGNYIFYVNGQNIGSGTSVQTFTFPGNLRLGGGSNLFVGNLCEVRMWSRALSSNEIAELYYQGLVPVSGQIGAWPMNEGTGTTVTDASGNSNTGTVTGAIWSTDVPMKTRLVATIPKPTTSTMHASLTSGSITSASSAQLDVAAFDVTVALWWRAQRGTGATIVQFKDGSGNDSLRINLEATNKLFVWQVNSSGIGSLGCKTNQSISPGVWHRLAFTYTHATATSAIYVDGVFMISGSANTARSTVTVSAFAGAFNTYTFMKDIRIWQRVLTAQQIADDYRGANNPTPLLWWPMEEGSASTLSDVSGNGIGATITSTAWTGDVPQKQRFLVGGNLAVNGDFEYAPPTGVATTTSSRFVDGTAGGSATNGVFSWYFTLGGSFSGGAQFDSATKHTGLQSLRLDSTVSIAGSGVGVAATLTTATGPATSSQRQYMIPVLGNTSYTLSGWIKTSGVVTNDAGGVRIRAIEYNGVSTSSSGTAGSTDFMIGTNDWTFVSKTFTTGSTSTYVNLWCNIFGDTLGTAWFDDIIFVPTVSTSRTIV